MYGMEAINIGLFRLSKGSIGGSIHGAPVILLRVMGRRTGLIRTKPLLALNDGHSWVVAASRGGTDRDPDWYLNLDAFEQQRVGGRREGMPELIPPEVEYAGARRVAVRTEDLEGRDRTTWWERLVEVYPRFVDYQNRASRQIPVVRLRPMH